MKGYSSANGDNRGILERFLPSTYRTTKDGSNAHNAFLGAIKGSIETTRDDMEEMSLQVYFTRATGKFLDLYGKYVGLSRNDGEEDQPYRDRIVKYIKTKRGTIEAIIDGIKNELGDPELPVSIYETWRNIFIMNQSTLNGLDYIMGEKYRYAVIEITVGKYVEPDVLTDIVDRYKAYGVKVLYRYALGMSDEVWNDPVDFSQEFIDSDSSYTLTNYLDPYYKKVQVTMGDSPITKTELSLFKMNASKLNGSDVISGNPENAYIFDYTNSPSYHILGYVPSSSTPDSGAFKDPYDYIYQGTKVDLSTVGTTNYVINSSGNNASDTQRPHLSGTGSSVSKAILSYDTDGINMINSSDNTTEWYYQVASAWSNFSDTPLKPGSNYVFSVEVKGTVPQGVLRWGFRGGTGTVGEYSKNFDINNNDWTVISVKLTPASTNNILYFRIQGGIDNQYATGFSGGESLKFRNIKIEDGIEYTSWNPAPEDTPKTYVYPFTTEPYLVTSRKDSNSYTFSPGNSKSTVLGVNVSRYFINNGYDYLISKYDGSNINSVNIYTKGSEIGLPRTDLKVTGTDGKVAKGQFNVLGGRNYLISGTAALGWLGDNDIIGHNGAQGVVYDYIPTTAKEVWSYSVWSDKQYTVTSDGKYLRYALYDSNKQQIMRKAIGLNMSTDTAKGQIVIDDNSAVAYIRVSIDWVANGYGHAKLEKGNIATDWSPAPEDVQSGYGIDYIYDNSTSTGSYHYVLNIPSPIETITVDDYYNYGYSNRLVTIKTPNIELPVGIFKGQSTGNISIPDYSYPDKNFLIASTNRFKLNIDSSSKGVMIYNYTSKNWENYDFNKYYEIGNYIQDAKSIQGAYMLVKFTDSKFDLKYFDLEFDTVTIPYTSNSVGYSNKLGQLVLDQSKLG